MAKKQKLTQYGLWLMKETFRIIEGCKLKAFDGITECFTPDASATYKAMWTRDFFYIIDGVPECATDEEVLNACTYLLNGQREDGIIPDRRDADGVSIYSAGPYGKKLGLPPADNSQFMVKLVHHYVSRSGDINYFRAVSDCLERALGCVRKSDNGLVYISPNSKQSSYGFIDTISLSENVLIPSLLLFEAQQKMQEMYTISGEKMRANYWKEQLDITINGLEELWCEEEGLYYASSEADRQLCIWGSCYAAYTEVCSSKHAKAISRRIVKDYDKVIRFGQVRHLLFPDVWKKTIWPKTDDGEIFPKPGIYQNGAYWSTASGWVAAVIRMTDENLADQMLVDLLESFKQTGIYEAINDKPLYMGAKDYCASATLVIQELRRIGINVGTYGE